VTNFLNVHIDGQADRHQQLTAGGEIGRDAECAIQVDHASIAPKSVEVSLHGEAVFARNLNTFPLYIGDQLFSPNAKQRWPDGGVLTLSEACWISLHTGAEGLPAAAGKKVSKHDEFLGEVTPEEKRRVVNRNIQIAVIALCVCLAPLLLLWDQSKAPPVSKDSFQTLVRDLRSENTRATRRILRHLQDAWRLEQQSSSTRRTDALRAYEDLLQCPGVREAAYLNSDTVQSRVKVFAAGRVAYLQK